MGSNFLKLTTAWLSGALLICMLITGYSCSTSEPGPAAPQNLKTEYQNNPLGLDTPQPRFSWQINESHRNVRQTAYQILVGSDPALLDNDEGDIWDSGKIGSGQSVHVPYPGPPLHTGQRCYWKVRTWDQEDNASDYSITAFWEMGLLSGDDWKGSWIGRKSDQPPQTVNWPWGDWIWHPSETGIRVPVFFRKKFQIPAGKKISSALARTTADNYFTLTLNGKLIGKGSKWTEVYNFDVKNELQSGANLIAVKAANSLGEVCGLIFSLKISFDDGSEQVINSDASWKTTNRKISQWNQSGYNDKSWGRAHVIGSYGTSEWGRIDPEDTYSPPRSILVRNEFDLDKKIKKARAYVTGLGSYVFFLNGTRIGADIFTPGWTDYPTRIQYQTYDVTSLLKTGSNAAGAILGNMWWSGGLGWKGASFYSNGPLRFQIGRAHV